MLQQLTTQQAERKLKGVAVRRTSWQQGAGIRYRIYKVPPSFDVIILPLNFQVLFVDDEGYFIVSEYIPV